jgi:hypothetical protein
VEHRVILFREFQWVSRKILEILPRTPGNSNCTFARPRWHFSPFLAGDRHPRSLSDLAPANSLCKTACGTIEAEGNEDFISSLRVRPVEANEGCFPRIHSKSAGGFAVSSLSDT